MKKLRSLFILTLISIMVMTACSAGGGSDEASDTDAPKEEGNGETTTITIAHVGTEDTGLHLKFVKFKEIIEEQSDGRFAVEIYPNSQMGDEREITESTQNGNIKISTPGPGQLSSIAPPLQVFNMPFLFNDSEEAHSVLDGPVGTELLEELEGSGLIGLGYAENGWRHLTTKEGPVISPDEVQGLKIRVMDEPLHLSIWKEIGLNPTPLAFSEVYTALSQGVVDAQENPLELIESMKFHEVNPYISLTGHVYDPEVFLVNEEFFNSLSEEDQQLIKDAAAESIKYQREINAEKEAELMEQLESEGATITELTAEEKEAWIEAVKPVYKEYADEIGLETLKKVLEAANNDVALEALEE